MRGNLISWGFSLIHVEKRLNYFYSIHFDISDWDNTEFRGLWNWIRIWDIEFEVKFPLRRVLWLNIIFNINRFWWINRQIECFVSDLIQERIEELITVRKLNSDYSISINWLNFEINFWFFFIIFKNFNGRILNLWRKLRFLLLCFLLIKC